MQKARKEQGTRRMMVLQTDGVFVLKRPEHGHCEGMEIKSAVLYPQQSPQDRVMLADGCDAQNFLPLLAGLSKRYCHQDDFIVGIGDGAPWVEDILDLLADKYPYTITLDQSHLREIDIQGCAHGSKSLSIVNCEINDSNK
jgi:hypothetical protein